MKTGQSQINNEAELRRMEMERVARRYSYDIVQKLTFFVIGLELIFCGYILLNADKLGTVRFSSIAFLLAGVAAIMGLLWRFLYNQTHHDFIHGESSRISPLLHKFQIISYWGFVILSSLFLILTVAAGYSHIYQIEDKAKQTQHLKEKATQKQLSISTSDDKRDREDSEGKRAIPNERK